MSRHASHGYKISTFLFSNKFLHLKNIFCAPKITKKHLLSKSKLTQDNNVIVKFDSKRYLVKDKDSKTILLQRILRNGLYQFYAPVSFISSVVLQSFACKYPFANKFPVLNVSNCNF